MWTIKWTFVLIFGGFVGYVTSQDPDVENELLDNKVNNIEVMYDEQGNPESIPEVNDLLPERFDPAENTEEFQNDGSMRQPIREPTLTRTQVSRTGASQTRSSLQRTATPCPVRPQVLFAQTACMPTSCKITCLDKYEFAGGATFLQTKCLNGTWTVQNNIKINSIPAQCEPICNPLCMNNGICISPGVCDCPENYMGSQCQLKTVPCLDPAPMTANSNRACTKTNCTVTCSKGFFFPDGLTQMKMECQNGAWAPTRPGLKVIPDCKPSCNPPCLNEGNCLSYNVCQCSPNFRGPQCQYNTKVCAPKNLRFNGGYNCSGSGIVLDCKLYCPKGIEFEFPPAEKYTCSYAEGQFKPDKIPQCSYDPGMSVVMYNETQAQNETKLQRPGISNQAKTQQIEEESEEEEIEEIVVTKKKVKKPKKTQTFYDEIGEIDGVDVFYSVQGGINVFITPKPTMCITFNGNKVKTFDGLIYNYELYCSHTLLQDFIDGTFKIVLRSCPYGSPQPCPHALEIFLQSDQYTIEKVDGRVKLFTTTKEIPIPVQMSGLKVSRSGVDVRIVMDAIPLTIIWDTEQLVQVEATPSIWNRTSGICGTIDGEIANDFTAKDGTIHKLPSTFVESWKVLALDKDKQKCSRQPKSEDLTALECETSIEEKADMVCADLLNNQKLANCLKKLNKETLLKNCKSDYCDCINKEQRAKCSCKGIAAVVKDCQFQGVMLENGWRDWEICPLVCTNGRIFKPCGPIHEAYCGSAIEDNALDCREGCFCPDGTILHENQCIKQEQCPCKLNGKVFAAKAQITRDCNNCTCMSGNWRCTSIACGSRCAAIGDPHYTTFDGKRYDFMGKCSYYLMKTDGICVEAENVACSGTISQNMNMLPSLANANPSCTKSVTIKFQDEGKERIIKLKQGGVVDVDGYELLFLPKDLMNGQINIRQPSSSFVLVDFKAGIKVWWDGVTRVYIDADASFRGKTKGLCGTFNSNVKDDFLTPEGDIESATGLFADKWKTKETCDFPVQQEPMHPCQKSPENKLRAEKICSKIRGPIFEDCHWLVDNSPFYQDCMYDVCACDSQNINSCACPILASYASECSRQGSVLNWRYKVNECAITCPIGQIYYQCGDACARTCIDVAKDLPCKLQCVEGCRCPEGQALDDKTNECVPVATCKCIYKNLEFNPGYKEVRAGQRSQELCTCHAAKWNCVTARPGDAERYPAADSIMTRCSAAKNEEFSTCEPTEPVTCKNMNQAVGTSPADCRPGCVCKKGFVLDVAQKSCVLPEKCSCHHSGKSFNEGQTIREDCNTCKCQGGKWKCTEKPCVGACSVWGDGHFTTFDGLDYDFHGVCNYLLSKGKLSDGNGYSITIQNVLCGSKGVTCSKSLRIALDGNSNETLILSADSKGVETDSLMPTKKILVHKAGIFKVIEIPHLGVQVKWDRFTRVYVKLDTRWKGRPQGLCGNNNGNIQDDMSTPSHGIETNPLIFGHSWKLDSSCQMPTPLYDSCADNPLRKTWSQKKCGILKSEVFQKCHAEVAVDIFHKKCVYDACACDQGGDCECLCTAIASYTHACAMAGIPIKWRTPDLCPMQCDPKCSSYSPCVSACPVETCENFMQTSNSLLMCKEDSCVEGCEIKKCENPNLIYSNDSFTQCQPKSECKGPCMVLNGVTYYEGQVISSDNCHTCTCSRGSKLCSGLPCPTTVNPETGDLVLEKIKCVEGWSGWINQDTPSGRGVKMANSNNTKNDDTEPIPTDFQMKNLNGTGYCPQSMVSAIECRTANGHKSPKATGQNVECSLERGLTCRGNCFDYEIRVLCECGDVLPNEETPEKQKYPIRPGLVKQKMPRPDGEPDYAHGQEGMAYRTTLRPGVNKTAVESQPDDYDYDYDVEGRRSKKKRTTAKPSKDTNDGQVAPMGEALGGNAMGIRTTAKPRPRPVSGQLGQLGEPLEPPMRPPAGQVGPMGEMRPRTTQHPRPVSGQLGQLGEPMEPPKRPPVGQVGPMGVMGPRTTQKPKPVSGQLGDLGEPLEPPKSRPVGQVGPDDADYADGRPGTMTRTTAKPGPRTTAKPRGNLGPGYALGPQGVVTRTTIKPPQGQLGPADFDSDSFPEGSPTTPRPVSGQLGQLGEPMEPPKRPPAGQVGPMGVMGPRTTQIPQTNKTDTKKKPEVIKYTEDDPDYADYADGSPGTMTRTTAKPGGQLGQVEILPKPTARSRKTLGKKKSIVPEKTLKPPQGQLGSADSAELDPDSVPDGSPTRRPPIAKGPRTTQKPRSPAKPINYLPVECDVAKPHLEHPFSCYKFLQCSPTVNITYEYIEKTCGHTMMFNPVSMTCDFDYNVIKLKPKCGVTPEVPYEKSRKPSCEDGFKYNDCATPCGYNACDYYGKSLIKSGKCDKDSHDCTPGCIPATALHDCVGPKVWRDPETCVNIVDCTCMTPSGVQLKPGQVITEPCQTCQCIHNEYICADADCKTLPSIVTPPPRPAPKQPLASCNPLVPMIEHFSNCSKYMLCTQLQNGSSFYQEQICQKTLLFNPLKLACDLPMNVILLKPQCDNSSAPPSQRQPIKEDVGFYVVTSTVTPPVDCDLTKLVPTMDKLPDSAFKASSFLSQAFKPEFARLNAKPVEGTSGGWAAKMNSKQEYLQITYPEPTALFGIIVQGHPMMNQYVTSFKIFHSFDGQVFHPLLDADKNPQIFAGSIDQKSPVKSLFKVPIEAKVVKISPLTWSGAIAMRVELLGCATSEKKFRIIGPRTTPSPHGSLQLTTTQHSAMNAPITIGPLTNENQKPLCDDPMGVENGKLKPYQIKFSSMKPLSTVVNPRSKISFTDIVKLSSHKGWMPAFDSKNEFMTFDFTGLRNLTGIITKGGEYGWVKSYHVFWSKDNVIWNEMTQDNFPKTFLGNVDESSPVTNYFQYPVNAQYLKIVPSSWYHGIELKVEPLGCFSPYPIKPVVPTPPEDNLEIVNASSCGKCPGVLEPPSPVAINTCTCYPPKYWNGEECTQKAQCPCVVGHMTYNVGEHYQTENCSECLCTLNGVAKCTPKVCPACKLGNRRVAPNSCSCKCEKCPEHTVLCATSGECIGEELWCNGVKDCADDETGCPQNEPIINKTVIDEITISKTCPEHSCPPGFRIKPKGTSGRTPKMSSRFSDGMSEQTSVPPQHYYIRAKYTASFEALLPTSNVDMPSSESCIQFMCVPKVEDESPDYGTGDDRSLTRCKEPFCPKGYDINLLPVKTPNECPQFTCEATPDKDAECHASGRTFTTFDGTEYKYEICDHMLARDIADKKWNVMIKKNCTGGNNICTKQVVIKDKVNEYILILLPDMTVNLDGYSFTVKQLQKANHAKFVVSKVGETLLYVSHTHGIWVIFDQFGDVRLGICARYLNQVDGLCGFYNNITSDDKRKPTGTLASTTVEFGDSWTVNKTSIAKCEPHTCPQNLQDIAWKMCNLAKDEVFKVCDKAVDINRFISKCLEKACDCLMKTSNASSSLPTTAVQKQCKCTLLSGLVTDCLAVDDQIHLDTWRTVHDCEASCVPPLVQRDCYRRKCEPTCNTINECPPIASNCFSGCYCPEGFVKKGSACVKPSECRDCVCDGFGKSQYLTYDRRNFTFDGNCTYLLSRDITLSDVHTFQIYATIGPCKGAVVAQNKKAPTCTQALHIIYGPQLIHIQRGTGVNLDVLINGVKAKLPHKEKWIDVKEQGKELNILLPDSQVELSSFFETMAFSIKVPSLKFGSKMEGLCGDCNGKPGDDLQINPIKVMDVRVNPSSPSDSKDKKEKELVKEFALSWLADEPKLKLKEEKCHVAEDTDCLPLPPETDPCFKILDEKMFGKCHIVIDPIQYVTACQQDLCRTGPTQKGACDSLAAYARECSRNGICVDFRSNGFCPMDCTAPFVFKSCGCTETCESIDTKEELIKSSSSVFKQDPSKLQKLKSSCSSDLGEGCFCPPGKVLSNNKCIPERECKKCDDTHFAGDSWFIDKCTECKCKNDTTIVCSKKQCPDKNTVCQIGFMAVESSTEECCKKFTCVPEPAKLSLKCPALVLPKCSANQINKVLNGTDGCSKYICECIPKNQCPPLQNSTTTEKGFKTLVDSTGCCPTSKLVCDRSLCPVKPAKCVKEFYEVQIVKTSNKTGCCDEYECKPPSNNCIAIINGKNVMKKPDENWKTADPCLSESCAFDTNGNPIIKPVRKTCNNICVAGHELQTIPNECCGKCVQTKCIVENKLYNVGEEWTNPGENCTKFKCESLDGNIHVSSQHETCPSVNCAPHLTFKNGCCTFCKMEALNQTNCLPETIALNNTINMIQMADPVHGRCKNVAGVKGITQCSGSCKSGTRLVRDTFEQMSMCECCSVKATIDLTVPLVCEDKYLTTKKIAVPSECSCSPQKCENQELRLLKLKQAEA